MVKTKTTTKTTSTAKRKSQGPMQSSVELVQAALSRLGNVEKFQQVQSARVEWIEKEWSRLHGNTSELDNIALTASKDLEDLKEWRKDIMNTWKRLVRDELSFQLSNPDNPGSKNSARLLGMVNTLSQKVENQSDRVIRIERKYLLPEGAMKVYADPESVLAETLTRIEHRIDDHGRRLISQATDVRIVKEQIKALNEWIEKHATTTVTTTSQSTSAQQPQT